MMPARRVARRTSRRTSRRMSAAQSPPQEAPPQAAAPAPAPAAPAQQDDMAEIQQLATMKDQGILTEEEFEAKKKQILGI
jgi:Short C-terminal domain